MTTITTLSLLAASAGAALALPPVPAGPDQANVRVVRVDPTRTDDIVVQGQNGSDRPISVYTTAQPERTSSSTYMVSQSDGDESYVIRIENGQVVQLTHDGKDIDADHFEFDGDEVRILDDDGKVIKTHSLHVTMPEIPAAPRILRFGQGGNFVFDRDSTAQFFTDNAGNRVTWDFQPKVMVGINQGVPDAALRYQLGLGEDQPCILIEKVIEGLPADRAGLHRYDVVVKVDGKDADDATLREVLAEKEPGEGVAFEVIRKGKPVKIEIKVDAYDGAKLMPEARVFESDGSAFLNRTPQPGGWIVTPGVPSAPDAPAAPGVAPEPGPGLYKFSTPSPDLEEFIFRAEDFADPATAPEAIRRLREKIREHADRVQLDGNRLMMIAPDGTKIRADAMKIAGEAGKQAAQAADAARSTLRNDLMPAAAERMDQLEKRLDDLDRSLSDRLERLFERLDSIAEQLKDTPEESDKDEI